MFMAYGLHGMSNGVWLCQTPLDAPTGERLIRRALARKSARLMAFGSPLDRASKLKLFRKSSLNFECL